MTKIRDQYMTTGQARELEHLGFIVRYVTITEKGLLFAVWAK